MTEKPAIHQGPFDVQERVEVDTSDGSPFSLIQRVALGAADAWALGPEGPYQKPQPPASVSRGQVREALLHLLELGLLDIDVERLKAMEWVPMSREDAR